MELSHVEAPRGIERHEIHVPEAQLVEGRLVAHDRDTQLPRRGAGSAHVVAVLVGEEDGFDAFLVDALLLHLLQDLLAADAGVDHYGLAIALDDGAVAVAPAGQYVYLQHPGAPQTFLL